MKLKGSMVLEAAYVLPLTLVAIFVILLLAYYQHDGIVLKSYMKRYLIQSLSEEREYDFLEKEPPIFYMNYQKPVMVGKKGQGRITTKIRFDVYPKFLGLESKREKEIEEAYKSNRPQKYVRKLSIFTDEK